MFTLKKDQLFNSDTSYFRKPKHMKKRKSKNNFFRSKLEISNSTPPFKIISNTFFLKKYFVRDNHPNNTCLGCYLIVKIRFFMQFGILIFNISKN
jgi:hypothetical protein